MPTPEPAADDGNGWWTTCAADTGSTTGSYPWCSHQKPHGTGRHFGLWCLDWCQKRTSLGLEAGMGEPVYRQPSHSRGIPTQSDWKRGKI